MSAKRIFSGIQPTGVPHIGNYLGAIKNWVRLQNASSKDDLVMFCVVDLHSCTTAHNTKELNSNIFNMVASLMACGIDPDRSLLFQQSQVSHHSSLAWFLSCLSPIGQLNRMHQWKGHPVEHVKVNSFISGNHPLRMQSKSSKEKENANFGLFSYPVLMAADILLYRATQVPVGHDQLQHVELTRDLTESFNKKYGQFFKMPEVILTDTPRIMSLRNPKEKMSKSDKNVNSRIEVTNTDDEIAFKIQKAVTDSEPYISNDLSERLGVRNIIDILSAFSSQSTTDIVRKYDGIEYFTRELKAEVTETIVGELRPIRDKYSDLINHKDYLEKVINDGSSKANVIAAETMTCVYDMLGMRG